MTPSDHLTGGTHNPLAPPFEFLDRVFLPAMRLMGAEAGLELLEAGFAPVGGGSIACRIKPSKAFTAIELTERGEITAQRIRVPIRNLDADIANRILNAARLAFPCEDGAVQPLPDGPGRGVACLVEAEFGQRAEMACSFGELAVGAKKVGQRAGRLMSTFLGTGAAVGRHLADQLLLPMALAGNGRFTTMAPDDHVATNISVIEKFLPVSFLLTELGGGVWEISCDSV